MALNATTKLEVTDLTLETSLTDVVLPCWLPALLLVYYGPNELGGGFTAANHGRSRGTQGSRFLLMAGDSTMRDA
ncbi:hypothetical protein N7478_010521 [Penicillium angulare]|uniref:uncharacterized protein n=1 Tax=Penicillium angulare TaxID=116970 RepID=UPI00254155F6|nr:uncharacterized protein N7478_010521 [Penicillium angulare]KAJ5267713.1 hypothetical protein N7478_010521 [Penicillium angulare]